VIRLLLGAASAAALVMTRVEPAPLGSRHEGELRPLLLRGSVASTISKAHLPLLIDLYWLRVLIGISEPETAERNQNLAAYGEFLTDLDPRFFHAYYYLGMLTPYSLGNDQYSNGELAIKLIKKGIARFPEDYRLRTVLAFLLTYIRHDSRAAVLEFSEIAKLPNAPGAAISSATALFVEEGRFDDALELIENAMKREGQGGLRMLSDRKKQLEIEKLLRQLDEAIVRAERKLGRTPETLEDVIAAQEWPAELTKDPHGGELTVKAGRGRSSWLVGRLEGIPKW
jgi:tetratricopeptide (TPR) repeat protein